VKQLSQQTQKVLSKFSCPPPPEENPHGTHGDSENIRNHLPDSTVS